MGDLDEVGIARRRLDQTPESQGGANKAVVVGVVTHDSELRAAHVSNAKAITLQGFVRGKVKAKSTVFTDDSHP